MSRGRGRRGAGVGLVLVLAAGCGERAVSDCGGEALAAARSEWRSRGTDLRLVHHGVPRASLSVHDVALAPDGAVWYSDTLNGCLGRLDPDEGLYTEFSPAEPGAGPHGLVVDPAGVVWYAAAPRGRIGRLDPATGAVEEHRLPAGVRDVHTLLAHEGAIWFVAPRSNRFGRLDPATGEVRLIEGLPDGAAPYALAGAADDGIWIGLSRVGALARFDPATAVWRHWPLGEGAEPLGVAVGPDGRVWYADAGRGVIGVLNPEDGSVRELAPTGAGARPRSLAVVDDGSVWYYDEGARLLAAVGSNGAAGERLLVDQPGMIVRRMIVDAARSRLWVATGEAGGIGSLHLPRP